MKPTLLFIFALFGFAVVQAQTAYQAPGVFVCNQSPANVHTMTPYVLGNQNPDNFTVTYHVYAADAQNGTNAIASTLNYCCGGLTPVYARVTANSSGAFAISEFKVVWEPENFNPYPPDQYGCESVQLPDAQIGAYYTEPNGQGLQYPPLYVLSLWETSSPTLYWYAGNDTCHAEQPFNVFIDMMPVLWETTLVNCVGDTTFNLNQIVSSTSWYSFYHSEEDAWALVNPIQNTDAYPGTDGEVIWVNLQSFCTNVVPLTLGFQTCTQNSIYGKVGITQNGSNCAPTDPGLAACPVSRTFAGETSYSYTNADGNYMFTNVPEGYNTVAPAPSQPYITVLNPTMASVYVSNSQGTADFCVLENPYSDVKTTLQSHGTFRPNITTQVYLSVWNKGNLSASGTITLTYDPSKINFVSATVAPITTTTGTLTFNYSLQPHASQWINLSFYTPTTTVMGDVLAFTANAVLAGDQDLTNNTATMNQTVVNSYDPNDISVAEGAIISPAQAQGYLHYMVRFQNTGTAEAFDVRIENPISELLDMDTFRPIAASHTYFTESVNNDVTFHFPNIDLPASSMDEPNSHGWVIYEVKPIAGIEIGDVIEAQAFIYFDTNPAIDTNIVTTTIQQLSTNQANADLFALYPNPTSGKFTIQSVETNSLDMEITDARGAKVMSKKLSLVSNEVSVDVSGLSSGLYFVKMASEKGISIKKLTVK